MEVYHNNCMAMNTRFDLVMPGCEEESADMVFKDVQKELLRLENKLSYFSKESIVFKLNNEAFQNPIELDNEMVEILSLCIDFNNKTNGIFDITIRPLLELLKQNDHPDQKELEKLHHNLGCDKLILHPEDKIIRFANELVKIDLGGFGKGYAIKKVLDILEENLVQNAFISFGGSSVSGVGKHPHGDYWPAGIQNVFHPSESLYKFKLKDSSLSTSGWSEKQNFFMLNPLTSGLVQTHKTVSVVSESPILSEVLSTALYIADGGQREFIIENYPDCNVVEIRYGVGEVEEILEICKSEKSEQVQV
jgi:FAD:protein FMN transferase